MTNVAFLGCGLIAKKRAAALPGSFATRTVYDVDRARATALAQSVGPEIHVASSPEDALAHDIHLAVIATYHRDLTPLARMAVSAGCHVLIEKPGGISASDLRLLREESSSQGRRVRVGYNHRFHPSMLRARELIGSGAYGNLMGIRARYGHGGRPGYEHEWRTDPRLSGGGELFDQGVHLIDLVRYLVGDVTLAFAELRKDFWNSPVEDNAYIALHPTRGGVAWLHASWTEWKNLFSLEVALQTAKIEVTGLGGSYGTERLTLYEMLPELGPPQTTSWEWPFPDTSWQLEMADIASHLNGGEAQGATLDDGIAVLDMVEEIYALFPQFNASMAFSATT